MDFSNPVHLVVRDGDNPIQFSSDSEVSDWLERQASLWASHLSEIKDAAEKYSNAFNWLSEHAGHWRQLANSVKGALSAPEADREKQIRHQIDQLRTRLVQGSAVWSGHELADRSFSLASVDASASVWILLMALGKARWYLVDNSNAAFWCEFGRAIAHLSEPKVAASYHRKQRAAVADIDALIVTVKDLQRELQQERKSQEVKFSAFGNDSAAKVANLLEEAKGAVTNQRDSFDEEWKKLRATYDAELKLRAPRDYWNRKFVDHGQVAANWRTAFFWTAFSAVLLISLSIWLLASGHVSIPNSLGNFGWVVPAGLVGIPAFLSLWLLRLCGRQWSDHLLRREDSRERIVMIETFLAISRDSDSPGAITDPAQLGLVLSSIFRSGPGMSVDDSPPAGFFEALMTRFANQGAAQTR